jgi:hypothetical protein
MADNDGSGKSWWSTMPGVLTALAGIITALGGLVAILSQSGLLGHKPSTVAASTAGAADPMRTPGATATAPAAALSPTSPQQTATPGQSAAAPTTTATNSPTAHSPAEVLAGLRAEGFKGLAVTHRDGTLIALAKGAEISGEMLPLANGQNVQFERIVSIEIEQPWDGSATLALTNGQRLAARLNDYNLYGKNELGPYRELLSNLKRIDFVR